MNDGGVNSADRLLDPTTRQPQDCPSSRSGTGRFRPQRLGRGAYPWCRHRRSVVAYKRRIGPWFALAGRSAQPRSRPMASAADGLEDRCTYRLQPDGSGEGTGPDGALHTRMRTWKQALRDSGDG